MSEIKQALFNFVPYPKTALAGSLASCVCVCVRHHVVSGQWGEETFMGEAWTERNRVTYKIVCQMHSMRYQSIARLDSFTLVLYNRFNGTTAIPVEEGEGQGNTLEQG